MKSPLQAISDLLSEDRRYKLEAYQFIRESLQYAHENLDQPELGQAHTCEAPFQQADLTSSELAKGLDDASEEDPPAGCGDAHHITGQQLCEACRQYAIQQYGFLSRLVLGSWGVNSTSDFGELVYNLIQIEQMRKSESDRREDFDSVFDFEDAFDPNFDVSLGKEK